MRYLNRFFYMFCLLIYSFALSNNINLQPDFQRRLFDAVHDKNQQKVNEFLLLGVNPNSTQDGLTLLNLAINTNNIEIVKALIQAGASVDKPNEVNHRLGRLGISPLMNAVQHGEVEMVTVILEKRPDINSKDEEGNTALIYVVQPPHLTEQQMLNISKLLIGRGADTTLKNQFGNTALDYAKKNRSLPDYKAIIDYLEARPH